MIVPDPPDVATLPHDVLTDLAVGQDWLGTWWPAGVLGVGSAVLVVVAVRRSRSAGRVRRRWPAVVGAALALLLACGAGVNTAVGYVPNLSAARMLLTGVYQSAHTGGGRITAQIIRAPANLRIPVSATWVYTPPGYHAGGSARYPVVYLLHGTPGQSADWFAAGDVASVMNVLIKEHLVRPMIIIAPDVNGHGQDDTECLDSTHGGSKVESYLSTVVVPWVDAHYRTVADWPFRAIGGMSSGGFCALDQGLRHPELYGSIIALEPYDNPGAGGRAMLSTQAQYDARSPGYYLSMMTFVHPVATFLDIGSLGSGDGSQTVRTAAQLNARGQEVYSRVEPGQGHNWTMARTGIPYGLVFVSQHMPA